MSKCRHLLSPLASASLFAVAVLHAGPAAAVTYPWSTGLFNPGVTAPNPLVAADTLHISAGASKQFNNVSFTNDGSVLWQSAVGQDVIGLTNASVFNNGLWEDLGTNLLGTGGSFSNSIGGTYRKSGAGNSFLTPATLVNNGTIDVQQGRLTLPNSFVNAGALIGNGEFSSSLLGLTNNGTVAPGATGSVGTLSLVGIYTQGASGTLAVDLTSMASFDQFITTSGGIFLGGTLALNCLGACSFGIGDTMTIMDGALTLSGSFASVTLNGFGTGAFNVVYDNALATVSLVVTQAVTPVPEPATTAMLLAGLGVVGWFGRARARAAVIKG